MSMTINSRENRRDNQEWTIQRHWQHEGTIQRNWQHWAQNTEWKQSKQNTHCRKLQWWATRTPL